MVEDPECRENRNRRNGPAEGNIEKLDAFVKPNSISLGNISEADSSRSNAYRVFHNPKTSDAQSMPGFRVFSRENVIPESAKHESFLRPRNDEPDRNRRFLPDFAPSPPSSGTHEAGKRMEGWDSGELM